jgi:hypothetical protein
VWDEVHGQGRIRTHDVERALNTADQWLAVNIYEPRWDALDAIQQAVVKAVAAEPDTEVETQEV